MNIYLEKTTSTNDIAKEKAASLPHGSVIFAEEQTGGRGRFGREFRSPPGTGIYFSVILHEVPNTSLVTPAAAVAVCRAVAALTGKSPKIKWVNDILLDGQAGDAVGKICGILSETAGSAIVVGIGINFTTDFSAFPELNAASVFGKDETPTCTREELSARVIEELLELQRVDFIDEYRGLSCLIGKRISYIYNNEKCFGTVHGIDDDGRLLVDDVVLCAGEVNTVRTE
ncbi:MAG: biotin--[acetyl-CoA-carboxylase] ligase [Oscillospiraceae bacterium]|nr:biotin--[acetyl-CoA-carboxylase] ligase [Oscillospiraceae bacterium]